jgi:hypothetical protein
VAEGRTQFAAEKTPLISRMELDANLNPVSYEYTRGAGTIRVRIAAPSSELTIVDGADTSSTQFRFPEGAAIVDNNFFHHYLLLLYRIKTPSQTVPIFVPQDMQVGQARVQSTGTRAYDVEDDSGRLVRLTVPAAKVVVER